MSSEKPTKSRILPAALLIIGIIAIIAGTAAYIKSEYGYIISDAFAHIGDEKKEAEIIYPQTVSVALSDFLADPRVEQNDALMLINTDHLLEDDLSADIEEYKDSGVLMNVCAETAYADIAKKVDELFGEKLYISSAYRTAEEQAETIAEEGKKAQEVGASEHQAGLALDVYVKYHAGIAFIDVDSGKWVNENCGDYGFIIRYPYYGVASTGIEYEPWHLRFVGSPHAEYIMSNRITLEEYIEGLELNEFYDIGGFTVTRQSGDIVEVPQSFTHAEVSRDNLGNVVITVGS